MAAVETFDGVKVNARNLLKQRGADISVVHRVDPDAILYFDRRSHARTAWLRYDGARLLIAFEAGWPAEPSVACERALARDDRE